MEKILDIEPDEINQNLGQHEIEILDFSTSWCPPCKRLNENGFPKLIKKYQTLDLMIYHVDGDACHDKFSEKEPENPLMKYKVDAYPTCIFYKDGQIIETVLDEEDKRSWICGWVCQCRRFYCNL